MRDPIIPAKMTLREAALKALAGGPLRLSALCEAMAPLLGAHPTPEAVTRALAPEVKYGFVKKATIHTNRPKPGLRKGGQEPLCNTATVYSLVTK